MYKGIVRTTGLCQYRASWSLCFTAPLAAYNKLQFYLKKITGLPTGILNLYVSPSGGRWKSTTYIPAILLSHSGDLAQPIGFYVKEGIVAGGFKNRIKCAAQQKCLVKQYIRNLSILIPCLVIRVKFKKQILVCSILSTTDKTRVSKMLWLLLKGARSRRHLKSLVYHQLQQSNVQKELKYRLKMESTPWSNKCCCYEVHNRITEVLYL